jgi:hypothetical protein
VTNFPCVYTIHFGLAQGVSFRGHRDHDYFQCLLWSDGAVPVDLTASKEAMMHHSLGEQEKEDCQDDYKQELSNSEPPGWFSFCSGLIQISCHQSYASSRSGACHGTAIL